jgi:hypothetical protein
MDPNLRRCLFYISAVIPNGQVASAWARLVNASQVSWGCEDEVIGALLHDGPQEMNFQITYKPYYFTPLCMRQLTSKNKRTRMQ